jgi:20S proteasome subunit beta 2
MVPSDTSLLQIDQQERDVVDHRISRIVVHDDAGMIGDDSDLLQFSIPRKGTPIFDSLLLDATSSMRQSPPQPLDLTWRFAPSSVVVANTDDSTNALQQQHYKKTGTTIVGVVGRDYCILGADTRATSGTLVADKRCWKLHPLSRNCAAAGAGTAADLDHLTRECQYQIPSWLPAIGNCPECQSATWAPVVPVRQVCRYLQARLYEEGGRCQAYLIVGGVDRGRGVLRALHPDGSMDVVSYSALGSGSLAAMGILESVIQNDETGNLSMDEAIALVVQAVKAGIDHDLGSGSQVDLCIISSDGIANYTRCYLPEETLENTVPFLDRTAAATMDSSSADVSTETWRNGINGFGNIPYVVRSKRIIHSYLGREEMRDASWDDILAA